MLDCFVQLLQDAEPEVRTIAAFKVTGLYRDHSRLRAHCLTPVVIEMAKLLERSVVVQRLLPPVRELAEDSSQYARGALASVIMGLARVLEREDVFELLLPLFLQLLRDQSRFPPLPPLPLYDCY